MPTLSKKDITILLIGALLSALSCLFSANNGDSLNISTPMSMSISAIFLILAWFLPLDQQLMFVALGLPNTKALGFAGISCSIIICAIVVLKNLAKTKNITSILLIVIIYVSYCTQYLIRFNDYSIGLVMPIKTAFNLLFFYILASNRKIACTSFDIGFKATIALFAGIVSAFWVSLNQGDTETARVAIEGNDPNMLAIESAFTVSYLCVYYYRKKFFSKWFFLGAISILAMISLLCGSRMGLILMAFVIGVSLLLNLHHLKRSSLLILVFGAALVAFLLSSTGQHIIDVLIMRNENLERSGNISNDRFELWSMYISVFNSDPKLWFIGLGDYTVYNLPKQAHNFLLEDIAAYGLIGVTILYLSYRKIYLLQYNMAKQFNKIRPKLFTMLPFFVPIIGGLTLHGLTNIMNTTMLYLGVLCMTVPKNKSI